MSRKFAWILVHGAALVVALSFVAIVGHVVWNGVGQIDLAFLTELPSKSGRAGGIFPILVSTVIILSICLVVALPLSLGTAVVLAEFTSTKSFFSKWIRRSLDVLAGIPSIVFGLFGNALFCIYLGMGFSLLSGGLTLACMVLPLMIRTTEEGLRLVPQEYRRSGAALAMSKLSILRHLILPAAMPSIVVGFIFGVGRALAETAALIFTSGYVDRMPESVMDSGRALSVHIFDLAMNIPGGDRNAYKTAFVLMFVILIVNGSASMLTDKWLKKKVYKI